MCAALVANAPAPARGAARAGPSASCGGAWGARCEHVPRPGGRARRGPACRAERLQRGEPFIVPADAPTVVTGVSKVVGADIVGEGPAPDAQSPLEFSYGDDHTAHYLHVRGPGTVVRIERSRFVNVGLRVEDGARLELADCRILDPPGSGIHVRGAGSVVEVEGGEVTGGVTGVLASDGGTARLRNAVVYSSEEACVCAGGEGSSVRVVGGRVGGAWGCGVYVGGGAAGRLSSVTVAENGGAGVVCNGGFEPDPACASAVVLDGANVYGCGTWGVYAASGGRVLLRSVDARDNAAGSVRSFGEGSRVEVGEWCSLDGVSRGTDLSGLCGGGGSVAAFGAEHRADAGLGWEDASPGLAERAEAPSHTIQ